MRHNLMVLILLGVAASTMAGPVEPLDSTPDSSGSYLVQAATTATAASQVIDVGGEVTHELTIIRAVGARLTPRQREILEAHGLRVYEDHRRKTPRDQAINAEIRTRSKSS